MQTSMFSQTSCTSEKLQLAANVMCPNMTPANAAELSILLATALIHNALNPIFAQQAWFFICGSHHGKWWP